MDRQNPKIGSKSVLRSGLLDVLQLGHLNFDDPKLLNRTRKGLS